MKKQFLILSIFILAFSGFADAQKTSAYSSGDNLLNAGLGLGSPFFGSGYSASLPVNPVLSYERGVTDEISIGGQLAFASSKYNYAYLGSGYTFKENATYIGARASYHLNDVLDIDPKFDVYGGASVGYVVVSVSDNAGYSGSAASAVGFGAFGGAKYYFSPKIAVFAEVGYQSLSFLSAGLAFKF